MISNKLFFKQVLCTGNIQNTFGLLTVSTSLREKKENKQIKVSSHFKGNRNSLF